MKKIAGIRVGDVNYAGTNAILGWTCGADRYHLWFNPSSPEPFGTVTDATTLFKNSVAKRDEPGHYKTRHVSLTGRDNAAMWEEAKAYAIEHGLIAAAIRERALLTALRDLYSAFGPAGDPTVDAFWENRIPEYEDSPNADQIRETALQAARDAIKLATTDPKAEPGGPLAESAD